MGIGATALGRANYAAPGLYSQAFFALSVGLERSAKLAIALDYAIDNDGEYPLARHYRTFGHKIDRLLAAVDQIARRANSNVRAAFTRTRRSTERSLRRSASSPATSLVTTTWNS